MFNPSPYTGGGAIPRKILPLGLLHIAAPLEEKGYPVTIINQCVDRDWKEKLYESFESPPLCFGVTSMTGSQIAQAIACCQWVKENYPDTPVIWGGIHASIKPVQVLENPFVDIVAIGEGEATMPELAEALESRSSLDGIKGIGFKGEKGMIFNDPRPFIDLDSFPEPSYHLVDMNQYQDSFRGIRQISLAASRGWIYDCAYCWDPGFYKGRHRVMSLDRIVDQITEVCGRYGIRGFVFEDDNFFIDLEWAGEVMEKIIQTGLGVKIGKIFMRADTICRLDRKFIDLMMRAGVRRVAIGAESGSPRILRLIKKRISVDEIVEANRKLAPYPIQPSFLFMMGLPTETTEEVGESVKLADRLLRENPQAARTFKQFIPFPGTELFDLVRGMGFREPQRLEEWARIGYRNLPEETPWISRETRRLVQVLDYALMCHRQDDALGKSGVDRADYAALVMARVYGPVARYRVRNLDARFPIEPALIKLIKVLMRREKRHKAW